jgi:hypothetical protein
METALSAAAALYALWVAFLAVMNLQRAHVAGTLGSTAFVLGLPLLVAAYALDVAVNMAASLAFWDRPHEWTLSERLTRYIRHGHGWRQYAAAWMVGHLLEPFDTTGGHRAGQ